MAGANVFLNLTGLRWEGSNDEYIQGRLKNEFTPISECFSFSDDLLYFTRSIRRDIGATVRVRYRLRFWRVRGRRVG